MTVNTQYVSFFHSLPLKAERSAMGQDRGGAAGPEKVEETSPPPLRPEPGLELEWKPWREVVENVYFRTRVNHSLCDLS